MKRWKTVRMDGVSWPLVSEEGPCLSSCDWLSLWLVSGRVSAGRTDGEAPPVQSNIIAD